VAHLVFQDAIEGPQGDGLAATLAQAGKQPHRHRLAQTEGIEPHARHRELERLARAQLQPEPLALEASDAAAAGSLVHGLAQLGVRHLVVDDGEAQAHELEGRGDLQQPEREVVRERGRAVFGLDAPQPLALDGLHAVPTMTRSAGVCNAGVSGAAIHRIHAGIDLGRRTQRGLELNPDAVLAARRALGIVRNAACPANALLALEVTLGPELWRLGRTLHGFRWIARVHLDGLPRERHVAAARLR
jgi:hypothetical protein